MPTIINLSGNTSFNAETSVFNNVVIDGLQRFNGKWLLFPEPMNASVENFVWGFTSQTSQILGDNQWTPTGNTFPDDITNPTDVDIYNMGVFPDDYEATFDVYGGELGAALTYFGWNDGTGWMESWVNGQAAITDANSVWNAVTFTVNTSTQLAAKGHNLSSGDNIDINVSNSTGPERSPAVLTPFDPDNFNPPENDDNYDSTFKHLYREGSTANSRRRFCITRTPRRIFAHADDTTSKYFGFHYHAFVDSDSEATYMSNHINETYLGQGRYFIAGIYASPNPTANYGDDDLIFIGGVGRGDEQYFTAQATPFRTKILEIPNSIEQPTLWQDSDTPNGGSDPSAAPSGNYGLYFYIVTGPHETSFECDVAFDNFACQEWVVKPSHLEQLRRDSDDFYNELFEPAGPVV